MGELDYRCLASAGVAIVAGLRRNISARTSDVASSDLILSSARCKEDKTLYELLSKVSDEDEKNFELG